MAHSSCGRPRVTVAAGLAALLAAAPFALAEGQATAAPAPATVLAASRVRALDPVASGLLSRGIARSATLRGLVEAIGLTDTIVYVAARPLALPGQTALAGASHGTRFVRITLNAGEREDRVLAWLGHELQHAVEIAGDPSVVTGAAMERFLRERGFLVSDGVYCTRAAQEVTRRVAWEVAAGPGRGARRGEAPLPAGSR